MIKTSKQLAAILNKANNRSDIEVVKDGAMNIIKIGGYESAIWGYGLKDLVNELNGVTKIKMVYKSWTMQGMKVMHINGIK